MGSMTKEQSFKLLDAFYEAGGNFIDTAVRLLPLFLRQTPSSNQNDTSNSDRSEILHQC
jgi:hypothetical protein